MNFLSNYFSFLMTQLIFYSFPLVDTLMLGHFDEIVMGGVGQGALLFSVVLAFAGGPINVLFAQFLSDQWIKNGSIKRESILTSLVVSSVIAVIIVILVAFGSTLFSIFQLPQSTSAIAIRYSMVLAAGSFVTVFGKMLLFLHRTQGRTVMPVVIVAAGSITNGLLNWLVLSDPVTNVLRSEIGVAITTLFAEALTLGALYFTLSIERHEKESFERAMDYLKSKWQMLLKKGSATGLRDLNDWLISLILAFVVAKYGERTIVANQVSDQVIVFIYRFIQAGCATIFLLQSVNWGLVKDGSLPLPEYQLKNRRLMTGIVFYAFVISVTALSFSGWTVGLFGLKSGDESHRLAAEMLAIHLIFLVPYTLQHAFSALLDVHLKTESQGLFSTVVSYLFIAPLGLGVWLLNMPPHYIWLIDGIGTSVLAVYYYRVWRRENGSNFAIAS